MVPGFALPSPGTAAGCLPPLQVRRGVLGSSLKNGVFLTVPESRDYAALSSLSDERQPTESRCARSFGCVGGILVFRDC